MNRTTQGATRRAEIRLRSLPAFALWVGFGMVGCTLSTETAPPEPTVEVAQPAQDTSNDVDSVEPGPDPTVTDTAEETPDVVEDVGPTPECTPETDWKCDDWEPCTVDACIDGTCVHTDVPDCCSEDAHCDDGIPCTYDECNLVKSECMHPFETNTCCLSTEDCAGGSACSTTLCSAYHCAYPVTSTGDTCACENKLGCDDGNPCTGETCEDGQCSYSLTGGEGCCASLADCDDGDDSTADQCQQGHCWHGATACVGDADCQGPGTCSTGTCEDGACVYPGGCCVLNTDCDDGVSVTTDRCASGTCVHDFGVQTPCTLDDDCGPVTPCGIASCVETAGLCSWSTSGLDDGTCCGQDADCPSNEECQVAICAEMTCVQEATGGTATVWSAPWDAGTLDGWTVTDDGKDAKWQITDTQAISSPYSLYYGRVPEMDYDVGKTTGSVLSPIITPPAETTGLTLRFWRSANIEPIVSSDKLWLELVTDGATQLLWDKNDDAGPGLGWQQEDLDLTSVVTGPFQLRFVFDSVDDINNTGLGVFVDDVELQQDCGSVE